MKEQRRKKRKQEDEEGMRSESYERKGEQRKIKSEGNRGTK